MVGIPGSGKSFFAEHFASTFNAPFVSSEKISTELLNTKKADSYDEATITRISNFLLEQLQKTGQTIIHEGASDSRAARQELSKLAKDRGYEPLFVWVQTESASAKTRATKAKSSSKRITGDEFDSAVRRFTPPNASEKAVVISGKHTYASQLKIVLKRLASAHVVDKTEIPTIPHIEGRRIAIR